MKKGKTVFRSHSIVQIITALIAVFITHVIGFASPQQSRPMVVQDLLNITSIYSCSLSPDEKWLAVTVLRSRNQEKQFGNASNAGSRSAIWLVSIDGRTRMNLSNLKPGLGMWEPVWAPDSRQIALIATDGHDWVRPFVYDLPSKRLHQVAERNLDLALTIQLPDREPSILAWRSEYTLLVGLLPTNERPIRLDELERTARTEIAAINSVARGRNITANVMSSEMATSNSSLSKPLLLAQIDVRTKVQKSLAEIPLHQGRVSRRLVTFSPTLDDAVILATHEQTPTKPFSIAPPEISNLLPMRIGVASIGKLSNEVRWLDKLRPALFTLSALPSAVRWSYNGKKFALIARSPELPVSNRVFVGSKFDGAWSTRLLELTVNGTLGALVSEDLDWYHDSLFVYGKWSTAEGVEQVPRKGTSRSDWWMFSPTGSALNLSSGLTDVPRRLAVNKESVVWVGKSGLWSLAQEVTSSLKKVNDNAVERLIPSQGSPSSNSAWLGVTNSSNRPATVYSIDSKGSLAKEVGTLPQGATPRSFSKTGRFLVYQTSDTKIVAQTLGSHERVELLSFNRNLDSIAKPEYRTFDYKTADGTKLQGALLMPYNYQPGRKYPMVVSVYGGSLAPSGDWASAYQYLFPHLSPLAGRGFAVMVPSIPLQNMGVPSDPLLDIEAAVAPAVERVIELGIADKERIGVMGHSYGGYSVFSLVTQSNRFKAAIGMSGVSDLVSMHGSMDVRYHFNNTNNPLWGPYGVETQQMRMGAPPTKDLERYIRNSPIFHVDKVNTPVLIIHGTLDGVPVYEGEKFFVELNRLDKTTRLVRYLGEGHSLQSPANLEHMYDEILRWFEKYLN